MKYDNADCNLWAAIALLRHEILELRHEVKSIDGLAKDNMSQILEAFNEARIVKNQFRSVTDYLKDRVDVGHDYMLDKLESSLTPKADLTMRAADKFAQTKSLGDPNSEANLTSELTPRQHEVLVLKNQGNKNAEIARELNISEPRVTEIMKIITKKSLDPKFRG